MTQRISNSPTLRLEGLACSRGEKRLFSNFDLTLGAREAVQITGANGRGKTTLLRTVCGLQRPAAGSVLWRDLDIHEDPDESAGEYLYLAHENALNPDLTPRENLAALARLQGDSGDDDAIERAMDKLGVAPLADRPCGSLSAGQRRRSALARLPLSGALLWLLDEPAAALDTEARERLGVCIADHVKNGGTVLFTTHEPLRLDGVEVRAVELPA